MRTPRLAPLLVLATTLAACSSLSIDAVWDTQHDFSRLNTYDWAVKQAETGPDLPYELIDRAVRSTVDDELSGKGFRRSDERPSFRVIYYVGTDEVVAISDAGYYGRGWGAYWGYGWYGSNGINVSQYDKSVITIDVISSDPAVGLVWRGIARAQIEPGISADSLESGIRDAVRKILEDFPPPADG